MGSGEVAGAGCTHHHTVVHVTWSSRRPDRSHHETPPHFPPALPPPDPGLRGPAKAQQAQQEKQRSAEGWQTTAAKRPQQQEQQHQEQQQPQQQRATSQGWEVWRGCCTQSQLQRTKLPHQLAAGLLQVHPEPGGAVLQVQQHEGGQPGQQGQGGPLPGSWPRTGRDISGLEVRSGTAGSAGRQAGDTTTWPGPTLEEGSSPSQTTERVTRSAWLFSIISTLTASGSTMCPVITRNLSSVKPSQDKSGIVK